MQAMSDVETKGSQSVLRILNLQCVYERIDLACKLCAEKGLPCGEAEKVWGERRRLITNQKNQRSDPNPGNPTDKKLPPPVDDVEEYEDSLKLRNPSSGKMQSPADTLSFEFSFKLNFRPTFSPFERVELPLEYMLYRYKHALSSIVPPVVVLNHDKVSEVCCTRAFEKFKSAEDGLQYLAHSSEAIPKSSSSKLSLTEDNITPIKDY